MDNKDSYFYISGFISLSLFLLFSSIFFIAIISAKKENTFAMQKDNYVSVSVDMSKIASSTIKKSLDVPSENKELIEKPIIEEQTVKEATKVEKKDVNIDNLFSEVWTKSIKKTEDKKQKSDNRNLQEIQKKIKKADTNAAEPISQKIQKINAKEGTENAKASTATEVNEYLAKIQGMVYEHFYPPENSQGKFVKAVIEINSIGKVIDFRILTYSDSETLNNECNKIKGRLVNVLFPKNPDNKSGKYIINLISN